MSAHTYNAGISYVPARKWNDRAEELLKDPDAYYQRSEQRTAQEIRKRKMYARKSLLQRMRRKTK